MVKFFVIFIGVCLAGKGGKLEKERGQKEKGSFKKCKKVENGQVNKSKVI
jgi:hypothetical protein